jgi:RNA polymerase sigma-70 factor (ECF subfamily)
VALDKLPPKYGDVLEWKYIEGYSVKEIALKMDLSPEAAQSLLARAKTAFREIYSTLARPVFKEAGS